MDVASRTGVVVIGRNEGPRLIRCLRSLGSMMAPVIYVDSGSTDGSAGVARKLKLNVIELDGSRPFTAARARNEGFFGLLKAVPDLDFVQFVDADCELLPDWMPKGADFLLTHPHAAAVVGHVRERFPQASIYNRMCALEWDTPVGEIPSSGGIVMVRTSAFIGLGGFREDLIAGEEPELCHRLRKWGWTVNKLNDEMALHDAAMARLTQWWSRNRRSGYSLAQAWADRGDEDPSLGKQLFSNAFWAFPASWLLWPFLWYRMRHLRGGEYATHIVVGKLPNFQGQLEYFTDRFLKRSRVLIEHK